MRRLLAQLAAVALVATAAIVALPSAPAAASYCSDGGVNVLVDASALGAGSQLECGPGPKAANAFKDDFTLTGYRGDPAYVCQIDGLPADGDCRQTDAYWALFVSDGGAWTYASAGAYSLAVDDGDSVAFVWQDSATRRAPGTAPAPAPSPSATPTPSSSPTRQPTGKPTRTPTKQPTRQPTTPPTSPGGSASEQPTSTPTSAAGSAVATTTPPDPSPSEDGKRGSRKSPHASEVATTTLSPSPTASASASAEPTLIPAAQQTSEDDGLPAWLALVALALVGIAAGAVVLRRRRAGDGP